VSLDAEQRTNAATIIAVGKKLGASTRDQIVALMTAFQESSLHNLRGGDRDSVGLFQQRNAWGTFDQRHDPAQAATMFYTGGHGGQRGLFDFKNRDRMSLTQEAQSVQVSAFPDAYAKWQGQATELVTGKGKGLSVGGVLGSAASSAAGAVTAPARLGARLLGKGADAAGGAVADAAGGAASAAVGGLAGDLADTAGRVLLIGTGVVAGAGLVLLGLNRMTGDVAGKSRHAAVALAPLAL
jgi:hypothetical protein